MEIYRVMEACDTAFEFAKCKCRIYSYVESHVTFITPNSSVLVGALIAAKLMGKQPVFVYTSNKYVT
jgi:U4/U6 small nuclear ribonucleoprotein PRP31